MNGVTKPFAPSHYPTYKSAFQGLGSQGLSGFYKGNLVSLVSLNLDSLFKVALLRGMDSSWETSMVAGVNLGVDLCLYPLLTMQSRFVLQRSGNSQRVYRGIMHCLWLHPKTLFQGVGLLLPQSLLFSLSYQKCLLSLPDSPEKAFVYASLFSLLINYPCNTLMRRL